MSSTACIGPYRELACAVLSKDFGLDVVLPADRLVPMIPQRLNYIHWLEDLLQDKEERRGGEEETNKQVFGIDVGVCAWTELSTSLCQEIKHFRDGIFLHLPPPGCQPEWLAVPGHRD